MKVKILYKNEKWFTVAITGMPRAILQELSRHRVDISPSVKSSRYTLKEIKGLSSELLSDESDTYGKYIYMTGDKTIDMLAHRNLATVALALEQGYSNDMVKTLLPEGYLCDGTYTMTTKAWNRLYKLRSGKEVYQPFRDLVEMLKLALSEYPISDKLYTPLEVCSYAVRTCWDSHKHSDNGGDKDKALIKRVGVKFKHASTLEHLRFNMELVRYWIMCINDDTELGRFVEGNNDDNIVSLNMRTVVEAYNKFDYYREDIIDSIPSEYVYLLEEK
jgi:thymidylate synthase ThyX